MIHHPRIHLYVLARMRPAEVEAHIKAGEALLKKLSRDMWLVESDAEADLISAGMVALGKALQVFHAVAIESVPGYPTQEVRKNESANA